MRSACDDVYNLLHRYDTLQHEHQALQMQCASEKAAAVEEKRGLKRKVEELESKMNKVEQARRELELSKYSTECERNRYGTQRQEVTEALVALCPNAKATDMSDAAWKCYQQLALINEAEHYST